MRRRCKPGDPDYGISRVDYTRPSRVYPDRTTKYRGWTVRLYQGGKTLYAHKFFADSKHGGKHPAHSAARQWRDEQLDLRMGKQ